MTLEGIGSRNERTGQCWEDRDMWQKKGWSFWPKLGIVNVNVNERSAIHNLYESSETRE